MTAAEDREKRAAVDALVYRLKNRGEADDEPLAAEFIAALWGRGWRPTPARRYGMAQPGEATVDPESLDDMAAFRAKAAAHAELVRAQKAGKAPPAIETARQEAGTSTDQEGTTE